MAVVLDPLAERISPINARDPRPDSALPESHADSVARLQPPAFTYRGYGDPHWRGQGCYLVGPVNLEEREIVLACGCHASVPWWTLEPVE